MRFGIRRRGPTVVVALGTNVETPSHEPMTRRQNTFGLTTVLAVTLGSTSAETSVNCRPDLLPAFPSIAKAQVKYVGCPLGREVETELHNQIQGSLDAEQIDLPDEVTLSYGEHVFRDVVRAEVNLAGDLAVTTVASDVTDLPTLRREGDPGVDAAQGDVLGTPEPLAAGSKARVRA